MACRSCHQPDLELILSLGRVPLANALLTAEELETPAQEFPLDLAFCPRCALVQILETVPPETLFREYLYFSSYSDTMLRHSREHATRLIKDEGLGRDSLALEIASNDGYLLQYFVEAGVPVLGVEPARNIARVAEQRGVRTLSEFFTRELAATLPKADVVIANNVLAHVSDLNGCVEGIRTVLKPGGVATIEVPYVKEMVERCEFDTIYHEHLCYFSVTSLDALFSRHGLVLDRVERLSIHGGSLLLFVRHTATERTTVDALLAEEAGWGAHRKSYYRMMAHRVVGMRESLKSLLAELKDEGARIAAYGAAAKGTTLLNCFKIGPDVVDYVVDRSPYKQGRFVPGVRLPIAAPERLLSDQPDYVLLLAWNFADEIMAQQAEYRKRGGKFILFVPELRVV
ncbi:MAG: class I SAM-dependent methyltransferase [Candidatus Rokubacteria bacterium]|nr:class I SAM-dependent methyltransferase [Candidatus Rokubacteria bacterium]